MSPAEESRGLRGPGDSLAHTWAPPEASGLRQLPEADPTGWVVLCPAAGVLKRGAWSVKMLSVLGNSRMLWFSLRLF